MAGFHLWLLMMGEVTCIVSRHFVRRQHSDKTEVSKVLSQTMSLVKCAALCSIQKKTCFYFEKNLSWCRPKVDATQCNYDEKVVTSTKQDKKKTAFFMSLRKGRTYWFFLWYMSDTSPMTVERKEILLPIRGGVTNVHYHVSTKTVYWITERNTFVIMRKKADSREDKIQWRNPRYGVLEFAIDNKINCFFFLSKYGIQKTYDFKKYHNLPVSVQNMRNEDRMSLDQQNRKVYHTEMTSDGRVIQLKCCDYDGKGYTIVYTSSRLRSFNAIVLDPNGLYAYVCINKVRRIIFKRRTMDKHLNNPRGSYCPVMDFHNRHLYVMALRDSLSVLEISADTGSEVHSINVDEVFSLEKGHMYMEIVEI